MKNKKKVSSKISLIAYLIAHGISIPHYCYHNDLSIAGNCRVCLVELKNSIKPIVSCATNAKALLQSNTTVYFDSALVKKARENILEFLLLNHPLDCPICDQGGDCDLQDQSLFFGTMRRRFYKFKRIVSDKNLGPIVKTVMTRCIHCTRCIRFASEIAGVEELGMLGRGHKSEIGTYVNKVFISELSGNVIDLCPVGSITKKSFSYEFSGWKEKQVLIDPKQGIYKHVYVLTKKVPDVVLSGLDGKLRLIKLYRKHLKKRPLSKQQESRLIKRLTPPQNNRRNHSSNKIKKKQKVSLQKQRYNRSVSYSPNYCGADGIICSIKHDPAIEANVATIFDLKENYFYHALAPKSLEIRDIVKARTSKQGKFHEKQRKYKQKYKYRKLLESKNFKKSLFTNNIILEEVFYESRIEMLISESVIIIEKALEQIWGMLPTELIWGMLPEWFRSFLIKWEKEDRTGYLIFLMALAIDFLSFMLWLISKLKREIYLLELDLPAHHILWIEKWSWFW